MELLKKQNVDATTGPLLQKIIIYTIPLLLTTLIQQLFNAVDIVVLGNMADSTAVASVAATNSVISLIVTAFVGISTGTRVVLARFIGAKDGDNIRSVTDTSLIAAAVMGVVIAVCGFFFAPWFLDITNCPEECYEGALIYVRIYVSAAPFILLYNFGSAVMTADGDTQRPLYYIMVGGATNVILNVILCLVLPQKVIAVAVATVVSQIIGAFLVLRQLTVTETACKVDLLHMRFRLSALGKVLASGLPMAFVHALFPLSNLQIQSAINSYGVAATAGNGAASTIETVLSAFVTPFGTTAAVFIGQNMGAKKPDRVKRSFRTCMMITAFLGVILGVATFVTARFWLGLIVGSDAAAIEYGIIRMSCTTLFYVFAGVNGVFASAILAHGYSLASAINSVFSIFVFRVIWMQVIYPHYETFFFVMLCFVVSWAVRMWVNIVLYGTISHKYSKKAKLPSCE
ncbi:MAG: MATE family efflux transporter [Clostridia bacterium]|nr:MATE family efflux transporter [Clostridia bacterium]